MRVVRLFCVLLIKHHILNTTQFYKLIEKFSKKETSASEQQMVDSLFKAFQKLNVQVEEHSKTERERIYHNISTKIQVPNIKPKAKHNYYTWATLASACVVAFVVIQQLFFQTVVINTNRGEQKQVTLPDGSLVILNANSELEYPKTFESIRTITLKGEAFFNVKRDTTKPFVVTSNGYTTQVLGTSFNINAKQQHDIFVSVNSGKVEVASKRNYNEKVVLIKDQQVRFSNQKLIAKYNHNSADYNAWTQRVILLKDTSVAELECILEDWYNVNISITDASLLSETLSGKFKNESLETVLQSIALIKHLKIEIHEDNTITISKKEN